MLKKRVDEWRVQVDANGPVHQHVLVMKRSIKIDIQQLTSALHLRTPLGAL